MPRSPALKGRVIDGVFCDPLNHERIAQCSDFFQTDRILVRGDDAADEMWSAMCDFMPAVLAIEEQCLRTLYRTPGGAFFLWTYRVTINVAGKEREADELVRMTRDQAWHFCQGECVTLLVPDFTRFPSRKRR